MSGVPIGRAKFAAYTLAGLLAGDRRAVPHLLHLLGRGRLSPAAAPTRCTRSPPWCSAASRCSAARGSAIGAIFGALVLPHHRRPALRLRRRAAVAAAVPGRRAAARRQPRRLRACSASATGWTGSDERAATTDRHCARRLPGFIRRVDPAGRSRPSAASCCCCSSAASTRANFLSPELPAAAAARSASFLGVIATGHDAGHPARPDRPVGALGGDGRAP